MELLIYLLGKYAAYSAWCYFGLGLFNRADAAPVGRALGFGLARLLMGIAFGFAIAFLVARPAWSVTLSYADHPESTVEGGMLMFYRILIAVLCSASSLVGGVTRSTDVPQTPHYPKLIRAEMPLYLHLLVQHTLAAL